MRRVFILLCVCLLLCACHTQKHTISAMQEQTQATGSRTSMQALLSFGSILQTLDFSADSVTIRMEYPRNEYCEDGGRTAAAPNSQREFPCSKPIHRGPYKQREVGCYSTMRITAHQPRVKSEAQSHNLVVSQQQEQDTVAIQNQANSHADVSSDTVGVATPMNGTVVAVIVFLAILIIATFVLLLFLKKWHIL